MSETSTSGAVGVWSYRTGAWFAVFGPEVTVLLPESERDRVVALWSLVDGGASFDEVLDGLLASGLSRLPGFALVSTDNGPTRVLLRGAGVRATLRTEDDEVVLDGGAGATWVERSVEGVTQLTVGVEGAQPAEQPDQPVDLPILTGLVRVSRIDHPPYVVPVASPETLAGEEHAAPPTLQAGLDEDHPGVPVMAAAPGAVDAPAMADLPDGPGPDAPEAEAADATADAPYDVPAEVPDVAEEPVLADAPADGAPPAEPAADQAPDAQADAQAPDDEELATVAMDLDALDGGDAAVGEDAADRIAEEQPAPADAAAGAPVFPPGGDPLSDPFPPQPPQGDSWDPWATPPPAPPPPGPPPSAPPVPAAPAAPPYAPPPPPLPVGSWEPVGGFPPPAPADPDHDGLTQAGGGGVEPDTRPPSSIPGQPPAPPVTAPVAKLLISDGQEVVVDRVVLIGRAPEARRFSSTEQPRLVTVPSRMHEISSTHVEVRPGTGADHGSAVVTDMGSTNGTVLVQPGLGPEDLKPGIAVQLIPGAIINLGDGITIQVTRP